LIGLTYFQEGKYHNAIEWLNRAIESDPKSKDILTGLAMCHTALMEYDLALIEIKKVREMDPSNKAISRMEDQVLVFSTSVISLPRISSEEIRGIFRTGDWLLYSIFKGRKDGDFDIGPVIVQYGKGVEKFLYESILSSIRDKIRSDPIFLDPESKNIRKSLWEGDKSKKIPPIPGTIKTVVGRAKRSIGLGQWKKMIREIRSKKANPLASEFLGLLKETGFSEAEFSRIGELCFALSFERNGAAHSTFYEYDEVMEKRKEIVGIINEIISIISNKNSQISL
jgi:tetratricopeptide (TPR) repeat protein